MQTMLNIKTDVNLKKEAKKLAGDFGISLSTIINKFLADFVKERSITFTDHPDVNLKTKKLLLGELQEIQQNKNMVGPFDNIKDFKKSLLS